MSMLAILLVAAQTSPITMRCPAESVAKVLSELSAKAGVTLEAQGKIGEDVLLVSVTDVPLEELEKQIADATTGEWRKDGAKLVLVRDESKAQMQLRDEQRRLAERFAKAIEDYSGQLKKTPEFSEADAEKRLKQLAEMNERLRSNRDVGGFDFDVQPGATPQERLMARIMAALDPAELAAMPGDTKYVYSNQPTRMQRPLGAAVTRALAAFVTEYAVWQKVADRYKPLDADNQFVDFSTFGPLKGRPAKLDLFVTKWGQGLSVSLDAKVVDQQGNVLTATSASVDAAATLPGKEDAPPALAQEQPIKLSRAALEIMSIRTGNVRTEQSGLSQEVREKLLNPEQSDPLSFGVGELLQGIADQRSKNLVALLPDMAFDSYLGSGSVTPTQAEQILGSGEGLQFTYSDKWISATPRWPAFCRLGAVSRAGLGQLVRDLEKPGLGSLEPLSKFAVQTPGTGMPNVATAYVSLLQPAVASTLDQSQWDLFRLYGGLTAAQKALIGKQGRIPVSGLQTSARKALERMLFFNPAGVPVAMEINVPVNGEDIGQNFESIFSEPTEAMPNGLTNDLVLALDTNDAMVATALDGGTFTAEDLGTQLAMRERPELFPFVTEAPMPAKFMISQRRMIYVALNRQETLLANFMLSDLRRTDNRLYAVADFPESFKSEVDKTKKEARESFKNTPILQSGNGSGSTIPPNP